MAPAYDYQKYNVFRAPDWRWQRVIQLCDRQPAPGRCSRRDDAWVRAGRNFLLRWKAVRNEQTRAELFRDHPGLYYAYEIYEKGQEDVTPRAYLEARLLARQTAAEIADAVHTAPEAVEAFEALFFNVTDRLDAPDWVSKHVLLPAAMRNNGLGPLPSANTIFRDSTVARPFLDGTLKLFAYVGGPHLLDVLITGFQLGKPLNSPDELGAWFDGHWSNMVRRRSSQAMMMFETNQFNVMELFALHAKLMEIERSDDSKESQRTSIERHIAAMVADIPWTIGDDGADQFAGTAVGRLDEGAAELRDDELLQLAGGAASGPLETALQPLALPPPRKKTQSKAKDDNPLGY